MQTASIFTERLELRPLGVETMIALYEGRTADVERSEGISLPADWMKADRWMQSRIRRTRAVPQLDEWGNRLIVRIADRRVVGSAGFHEPPGMHPMETEAPGIVEFGYGVDSAFRRNGYAYEASRGLIDWALARHSVTLFQLSTRLDNVASLGLAAKLGFERHREYDHPQRGREVLLRLRLDKPR